MGKYMKSFKEFVEETTVDEAMTLQQRMKAKQTFRKNKAKIAMGRKKAEKKAASPEKLKARALKRARKAVEKKLLKGKSKDELSYSARSELEKRVDKKKNAIERLARKILPQVRQDDKDKFKAKKGE
jgi:protein subunit release factor A